MPGGVSRWNAQKDLSWEPLRPELVAEVRYEHVLGGRFRHGGRLVRFRSDRTPDSCTYAQLEEVAPAELADIFKLADAHLRGAGLGHPVSRAALAGGCERARYGIGSRASAW